MDILFKVIFTGIFLAYELLPATTKSLLPRGRFRNLRSKRFAPLLTLQEEISDNSLLRRAKIYLITPDSVVQLQKSQEKELFSSENSVLPLRIKQMLEKIKSTEYNPVLPAVRINELPVQKSVYPLHLFDKNGMIYLSGPRTPIHDAERSRVVKNLEGKSHFPGVNRRHTEKDTNLVDILRDLQRKGYLRGQNGMRDLNVKTAFEFSDLVY